MKKNSFFFKEKWMEDIDQLDSRSALELYRAITIYAIYGRLTEIASLAAKVAFAKIRREIDIDNNVIDENTPLSEEPQTALEVSPINPPQVEEESQTNLEVSPINPPQVEEATPTSASDSSTQASSTSAHTTLTHFAQAAYSLSTQAFIGPNGFIRSTSRPKSAISRLHITISLHPANPPPSDRFVGFW